MIDAGQPRQRVLVVAAYPALRAGLLALLASDPTLDAMIAEGTDLGGDPGPAPSAIVADYSAGEPESMATVVDSFPGVALVLIGGDPANDGPGLSGSPVAYLPSDVDAQALVAAVHAVAAGLIVLDPTVAGATGIHTHLPESGGGESLTAREREVLQLVAEGYPNKAIARAFQVTCHSFRNLVRRGHHT